MNVEISIFSKKCQINLFFHLDLNTPSLRFLPSENVYEGESVVMTCDVDGSKPISYRWYKDGVILSGIIELVFLKNYLSLSIYLKIL